MFQTLRPNSQIYILHKGDNPRFEIGIVTNVSVPRNKYGIAPNFTSQEMIVDVIAKVDDCVVNYNNLPANLDVADSFMSGEQIVISDNKEAMNSEIVNLKNKSIEIINSIDLHKRLQQEYDKILSTLNPEIAEKQTQKEEMNSIKNQMLEMNKNIVELMSANRLLMEQLKERNKYENVGNN